MNQVWRWARQAGKTWASYKFLSSARRQWSYVRDHDQDKDEPHRRYDRPVLHYSHLKYGCVDPDFERHRVFCTDGETIGHHLPGKCPFAKVV